VSSFCLATNKVYAISYLNLKLAANAELQVGQFSHDWQPHNKPFSLCFVNQGVVINLDTTIIKFKHALIFVSYLVSTIRRTSLLFASSIPEPANEQHHIKQTTVVLKQLGYGYVVRWLPGYLSNLPSLIMEYWRNVPSRLKQPTASTSVKKSLLHTNYCGLRTMVRFPDLVCFFSASGPYQVGIREVNKLGVSAIIFGDTDSRPCNSLSWISGNDDQMLTFKYQVSLFRETLLRALKHSVFTEIKQVVKNKQLRAIKPTPGGIAQFDELYSTIKGFDTSKQQTRAKGYQHINVRTIKKKTVSIDSILSNVLFNKLILTSLLKHKQSQIKKIYKLKNTCYRYRLCTKREVQIIKPPIATFLNIKRKTTPWCSFTSQLKDAAECFKKTGQKLTIKLQINNRETDLVLGSALKKNSLSSLIVEHAQRVRLTLHAVQQRKRYQRYILTIIKKCVFDNKNQSYNLLLRRWLWVKKKLKLRELQIIGPYDYWKLRLLSKQSHFFFKPQQLILTKKIVNKLVKQLNKFRYVIKNIRYLMQVRWGCGLLTTATQITASSVLGLNKTNSYGRHRRQSLLEWVTNGNFRLTDVQWAVRLGRYSRCLLQQLTANKQQVTVYQTAISNSPSKTEYIKNNLKKIDLYKLFFNFHIKAERLVNVLKTKLDAKSTATLLGKAQQQLKDWSRQLLNLNKKTKKQSSPRVHKLTQQQRCALFWLKCELRFTSQQQHKLRYVVMNTHLRMRHILKPFIGRTKFSKQSTQSINAVKLTSKIILQQYNRTRNLLKQQRHFQHKMLIWKLEAVLRRNAYSQRKRWLRRSILKQARIKQLTVLGINNEKQYFQHVNEKKKILPKFNSLRTEKIDINNYCNTVKQKLLRRNKQDAGLAVSNKQINRGLFIANSRVLEIRKTRLCNGTNGITPRSRNKSHKQILGLVSTPQKFRRWLFGQVKDKLYRGQPNFNLTYLRQTVRQLTRWVGLVSQKTNKTHLSPVSWLRLLTVYGRLWWALGYLSRKRVSEKRKMNECDRQYLVTQNQKHLQKKDTITSGDGTYKNYRAYYRLRFRLKTRKEKINQGWHRSRKEWWVRERNSPKNFKFKLVVDEILVRLWWLRRRCLKMNTKAFKDKATAFQKHVTSPKKVSWRFSKQTIPKRHKLISLCRFGVSYATKYLPKNASNLSANNKLHRGWNGSYYKGWGRLKRLYSRKHYRFRIDRQTRKEKLKQLSRYVRQLNRQLTIFGFGDKRSTSYHEQNMTPLGKFRYRPYDKSFETKWRKTNKVWAHYPRYWKQQAKLLAFQKAAFINYYQTKLNDRYVWLKNAHRLLVLGLKSKTKVQISFGSNKQSSQKQVDVMLQYYYCTQRMKKCRIQKTSTTKLFLLLRKRLRALRRCLAWRAGRKSVTVKVRGRPSVVDEESKKKNANKARWNKLAKLLGLQQVYRHCAANGPVSRQKTRTQLLLFYQIRLTRQRLYLYVRQLNLELRLYRQQIKYRTRRRYSHRRKLCLKRFYRLANSVMWAARQLWRLRRARRKSDEHVRSILSARSGQIFLTLKGWRFKFFSRRAGDNLKPNNRRRGYGLRAKRRRLTKGRLIRIQRWLFRPWAYAGDEKRGQFREIRQSLQQGAPLWVSGNFRRITAYNMALSSAQNHERFGAMLLHNWRSGFYKSNYVKGLFSGDSKL